MCRRACASRPRCDRPSPHITHSTTPLLTHLPTHPRHLTHTANCQQVLAGRVGVHHHRVCGGASAGRPSLRRLIVMGIGILVGLAMFFSIRFMKPAKLINGIANVFLIIGIILVPAGCVLGSIARPSPGAGSASSARRAAATTTRVVCRAPAAAAGSTSPRARRGAWARPSIWCAGAWVWHGPSRSTAHHRRHSAVYQHLRVVVRALLSWSVCTTHHHTTPESYVLAQREEIPTMHYYLGKTLEVRGWPNRREAHFSASFIAA